MDIQPEGILMNERISHGSPTSLAIELFQPKPNVLYSLDVTAHLAGISRRSILIYCRAGLVRPVIHPPYGVMEFAEEAIYTLRRIEHLRTVDGLDLAWIKTIFDLLDEVEHLRNELHFLQNH
jgi:DNA-binding transcriptional MerR regulator